MDKIHKYEQDKRRKIIYPNIDSLRNLDLVIKKLAEVGKIKSAVRWANKNCVLGKELNCNTLKRMILTVDVMPDAVGDLLNGVYVRNKYEVIEQKKVLKPKDKWERVTVFSPVDNGIIDKDALNRARRLIIDNRKNKKYPTKTNTYALSGLLICSKCGGKMYGHPQKNGNTKYRCKECHYSVDQAKYDNYIYEVLNNMVLETGEINKQLDNAYSESDLKTKKDILIRSINQFHSSINECNDGIRGLLVAQGRKQISDELFNDQLEYFNQKIKNAEKYLRENEEELRQLNNVKEERQIVLDKLESIKKIIVNITDNSMKNLILRQLVKTIKMSDAEIDIEVYPYDFIKYINFEGNGDTPMSLRICYGQEENLQLPAASSRKLLEENIRPDS